MAGCCRQNLHMSLQPAQGSTSTGHWAGARNKTTPGRSFLSLRVIRGRGEDEPCLGTELCLLLPDSGSAMLASRCKDPATWLLLALDSGSHLYHDQLLFVLLKSLIHGGLVLSDTRNWIIHLNVRQCQIALYVSFLFLPLFKRQRDSARVSERDTDLHPLAHPPKACNSGG